LEKKEKLENLWNMPELRSSKNKTKQNKKTSVYSLSPSLKCKVREYQIVLYVLLSFVFTCTLQGASNNTWHILGMPQILVEWIKD
jgi:hypothetical protein